ncbi:hypothetical protein [Novosphingobium sp.]|uniref:hypothetical protein n=1 Tax=Novosphingobium sp. TaxID=1874826 RepID=UPI0035B185BF
MKAIRPNHRPLPIAHALGVLGFLTSCAAPQQAPAPLPAPAPAPSLMPKPQPAPLPPPPADWRDAPRTPGNWSWSNAGGKSVATYGSSPAAALVTFTCDRVRGEVLIARAALGGGQVPMALTSTTGTRALLSQGGPNSESWQVAALKAGDPVLDAIAFSRGRFALEVAGQPTLYLPSWPEVGRVVQDCR